MTTHGRATGLVLAGPSSVGKTSVARALLDLLPTRWVFLQADRFLEHKTVQPGEKPTLIDVSDDLAIRTAGIRAAQTCIRLGFAKWQYENESWDYPADLELETGEATPAHLAADIARWLEGIPTPIAFRAMLEVSRAERI